VLHVSEELDAGDIILQRAVAIHPDDTAATLEARLAKEGAALLVEALGLLEVHRAPRRPQDPSRATFAPKLTHEEGLIRWGDPAQTIVNLIRAFDPWPVAYTLRDGVPLKIWRAAAHPSGGPGAPGTVLQADRNGLVVAAGTGAVQVLDLQPASGRRMTVADYLRGHPLTPGTVLGTAKTPPAPPAAG
jgi:methionyl-tRNA formyltransferase